MTVDYLISLQTQLSAKMKENGCDREIREKLSSFCEESVWFAGQYVDYQEKHKKLEAAKLYAEKALEIAQQDAKKNAWKWQARKVVEEPAAVVKARKDIEDAKASIEALEKDYDGTVQVIARLRAFEQEGEELKAWYAGGPEPASVRVDEANYQAELLSGCVPITRGLPALVEEPEDDSWIPMSVEDYALSLLPKPVIMKEEEIVYSSGRPSALFRRLQKRFKARVAVNA